MRDALVGFFNGEQIVISSCWSSHDRSGDCLCDMNGGETSRLRTEIGQSGCNTMKHRMVSTELGQLRARFIASKHGRRKGKIRMVTVLSSFSDNDSCSCVSRNPERATKHWRASLVRGLEAETLTRHSSEHEGTCVGHDDSLQTTQVFPCGMS